MKKFFECPVCHEELEAELEWSGQKTQCPYCKNEIVIPNFSDETEKAESPSCKKDVSSRKRINIIQLGQALLGIIQTAILAVILFVLMNNGIKVNIPREGQNSKKSIPDPTESKEENNTDPYAELKKQYALNNRHIEFIKQQPAPEALQVTTPAKKTRLMMLVALQDYYNWGYSNCKRSHYSIRVRSVGEKKEWGNGYIARDSADGKMLFNKLKDGKWHFAEIEIRYGERSYDGVMGKTMGDMFDIIKVIDLR